MSDLDYGFLHHAAPDSIINGVAHPGPRSTERVRIMCKGPDWVARYEGRWRKVHIQVRRLYIVYRGERITILIEGV